MKRFVLAALMASCSILAVSAQTMPTTPGSPQPTTRPGPSNDGNDLTSPTPAPGNAIRDEARDAAREAGEAVDRAADGAADAAGDAAEATGDAVDKAADGAAKAADDAAKAAGEAASDAAETVDEATTDFNQMFIDGVPPLRGANSFTEAQAKSWIEGYGFTNVQGLTLSDDGVWRATVDGKDKKPLAVAFDFQSNLTLMPSDSMVMTAEGDDDATAAQADRMPGSAGAGGRTGVSDEGQGSADATTANGRTFTDADIKSRLEAHGFSELQNLKADAPSGDARHPTVWRADAKYNGKDVNVLADARGFITILN